MSGVISDSSHNPSPINDFDDLLKIGKALQQNTAKLDHAKQTVTVEGRVYKTPASQDEFEAINSLVAKILSSPSSPYTCTNSQTDFSSEHHIILQEENTSLFALPVINSHFESESPRSIEEINQAIFARAQLEAVFFKREQQINEATQFARCLELPSNDNATHVIVNNFKTNLNQMKWVERDQPEEGSEKIHCQQQFKNDMTRGEDFRRHDLVYELDDQKSPIPMPHTDENSNQAELTVQQRNRLERACAAINELVKTEADKAWIPVLQECACQTAANALFQNSINGFMVRAATQQGSDTERLVVNVTPSEEMQPVDITVHRDKDSNISFVHVHLKKTLNLIEKNTNTRAISLLQRDFIEGTIDFNVHLEGSQTGKALAQISDVQISQNVSAVH